MYEQLQKEIPGLSTFIIEGSECLRSPSSVFSRVPALCSVRRRPSPFRAARCIAFCFLADSECGSACLRPKFGGRFSAEIGISDS